jgi:hypothetical protein
MPFRAAPVLMLLLAALAGPSLAQQEEREAPPPRFEPSRSELPESVLRAERETGGQVLRAESMQRDGREVYRLKVLTPDGRVRIMRDDPRERRREAWRESRRDELRDAFDEPRPAADEPFDNREERRFDERRFDAPIDRREPAPVPPPADLAMPETLPPVERGERY